MLRKTNRSDIDKKNKSINQSIKEQDSGPVQNKVRR